MACDLVHRAWVAMEADAFDTFVQSKPLDNCAAMCAEMPVSGAASRLFVRLLSEKAQQHVKRMVQQNGGAYRKRIDKLLALLDKPYQPDRCVGKRLAMRVKGDMAYFRLVDHAAD